MKGKNPFESAYAPLTGSSKGKIPLNHAHEPLSGPEPLQNIILLDYTLRLGGLEGCVSGML
ncbi:hypothetical protein D3C81_1902680 [compost metagenome]